MIVIHYNDFEKAGRCGEFNDVISITEKDAIEKYYDKWKLDMMGRWPDKDPDICFTQKDFITDFIIVNWAWTTEEKLR